MNSNNNKMYYLCLLCLEHKDKLTSYDNSNLRIEEKLQFFIQKYLLEQSKIPKYICDSCLELLNTVYTFKQKCLKNIVIFNNYIQKLAQENSLNTEESNKFYENRVNIQNIKQEFSNVEIFETDNCEENPTIDIKQEIDDNDEDMNEASVKDEVFVENFEMKTEINEELIIKEDSSSSDIEDGNATNTSGARFSPRENKSNNYCCVHGCTSKSCRNPDIRFHLFPKPNAFIKIKNDFGIVEKFDRRKKWQQVLKIRKDISKYMQVCSLHFKKSDYILPEIIQSDEEQRYLCDVCNKTFKALFNFENHKKIHIGPNLLPLKSRQVYEKQYKIFMTWCQEHKIKNFTENVFLSYFSSKASSYKSSTLWSAYSMLKSTLAIKDKIDIGKYTALHTFIKKQNVGYKPKKSKTFSQEEIKTFLCDAPNESYLMWKVCLIFGIAAACGRDELRNMKVQDIADEGNKLIITVRNYKSGKERIGTVTDEFCEEIQVLDLFRTYLALRPKHCEHDTLFINYRLGKCTTQVVGIHTFAKIPSLIARYLHLPDESDYTSHCYRRTSALISLKNT